MTTAPLSARRVELCATAPSDYEELFRSAQEPGVAQTWRTRGLSVTFDQFVSTLWADTFIQFSIRSRSDRTALGAVSLYSVDLRNSYGYVAAFLSTRGQEASVVFEVAMLFLNYVKTTLNLRAVYAEVGPSGAHQFGLGFGRLFTVEAVLPDREYFAGAYQPVTISRCDLDAIGQKLDAFAARLDRT